MGKTNDLRRRIRQHNGEICGGASATRRMGGPWRPLLVIAGFESNREALQCEWRMKHPGGMPRSRLGRRGGGGPAAVSAIGTVLRSPASGGGWTRSSPALQSQRLAVVCVVPGSVVPDHFPDTWRWTLVELPEDLFAALAGVWPVGSREEGGRGEVGAGGGSVRAGSSDSEPDSGIEEEAPAGSGD